MKNGILLVTTFVLGACAALAAMRAGWLQIPQPRTAPQSEAPASSHEQPADTTTSPPPSAAHDTARPRPEPARAARFTVCDASAGPPTLRAIKLTETDSSIWALHCGRSVELITLEGRGGTLVPRRIAHVEAHAPSPELSLRSTPVLAADISGDGRRDLIVSFRFHDPTGAPRSGAVYQLVRDVHGGFGPVQSLGALPISAAVSGSFVSGAGVADLALIGLQDPRLSLPSDLVLMRGGPAPLRVQNARLGVDARDALAIDMDLDARDDLLLASAQPSAELIFFDTLGAIRARTQWDVAGARQTLGADIDGDGHADAVIVGDSVAFVLARKETPLQLVPIADSAGLNSLHATDLDADGRTDFIGHAALEVIALMQRNEQGFERRVVCKLPPETLTPLAIAVASQDPETGLLLLVIGTSTAAPTHIELGLARCAGASPAAWQGRAEALQDAPLSLRFDLR